MNYSELIQAYFERSVALQWYWTIYVLVIGGIVAFSTFRLQRQLVTTILITILFACFAFKNEGAIEATAEEARAAVQIQSPINPSETLTVYNLNPALKSAVNLLDYNSPNDRRYFNAFALQIKIDHAAQDSGLVCHPDKWVPEQVLWSDLLFERQGMVARHQHDQRLLTHRRVFEIETRFSSKKGQIQPAARERVGQVR